MFRELASIAVRACIDETSSVIADRKTVTMSVQISPSNVPRSCPTISKTGFNTIDGFPPARPAKSISIKITRRICPINPSGELVSGAIVFSPVGRRRSLPLS